MSKRPPKSTVQAPILLAAPLSFGLSACRFSFGNEQDEIFAGTVDPAGARPERAGAG